MESLRGKGDHGKPTQIVNKNYAIWAKEFDMVLDMGKPPPTGSMKEAISGIMMEEVAFLQTSTLQVIDTLINFIPRYVRGSYSKSMGEIGV